MFCPEISFLGAYVNSVTYSDPAIGNGCHYLPTSLVWTWFCPEISLLGACVKSDIYVLLLTKLVNNWPCNWKWVPLPAQASSEHVLPRNLLTGGSCKIRHLCSTAQKLVNHWPCNWKWVPLPAHKPRLNMVLPRNLRTGGLCKIRHLCSTAYQTCEQLTLQLEMGATTSPQASSEHVLPRNLLTGGSCKIRHLCSTAQKLVNHWPCNWKWVPLPAHKPRLNMFCPEISLLGACVKSGTYVLLLKNLWTTDPAIGNGCHYLPTSLVWTCFAQKSPYWGPL